jgi:hypothetical protein
MCDYQEEEYEHQYVWTNKDGTWHLHLAGELCAVVARVGSAGFIAEVLDFTDDTRKLLEAQPDLERAMAEVHRFLDGSV